MTYAPSKSSAKRALRGGVCALAMLLAAGCAAGIKGRADPPKIITEATNSSVYVEQIAEALAVAKRAEAAYCLGDPTACAPTGNTAPVVVQASNGQAAAPDEAAMTLYRNNYAYSMMSAYDLALQDYARSLSVEGRGMSFFAHLAQLGLTTAATISKVEETSRVLSALATAAIGVETGYSEKLLIKQTIEALIDKMRAEQIRHRVRIVERMKTSISDYPLTAVRLDVNELGSAATIETALTALTADAKKDRDAAESAEDTARVTEYCKTEYSDRLTAWFKAPDGDDALRLERYKATVDFLEEEKITVPPWEFLIDCKHKDAQKKFVTKMTIP